MTCDIWGVDFSGIDTLFGIVLCGALSYKKRQGRYRWVFLAACRFSEQSWEFFVICRELVFSWDSRIDTSSGTHMHLSAILLLQPHSTPHEAVEVVAEGCNTSNNLSDDRLAAAVVVEPHNMAAVL